MGFDAGSWNFFESGHGKGSPDAIGGSLKRSADALVNTGCDIPDARKLYHFLDNPQSLIKLYFIEESLITSFDKQCSKTLKAIPGTMKLHQLQTDEELNVSYRDLSCFCDRPTICNCYNLRRSKFPALEINRNVSISDDIVQPSCSTDQLPPSEFMPQTKFYGKRKRPVLVPVFVPNVILTKCKRVRKAPSRFC